MKRRLALIAWMVSVLGAMLPAAQAYTHEDVTSRIVAWQEAWEDGAPVPAGVIEELHANPIETSAHLVSLIADSSITTAEFAVNGLREVLDGRALDQVLVEALGAKEPDLRRQAAGALGILFKEGLIAELLTHLQCARGYSSLQFLNIGRTVRSVLAPDTVSAEEVVRALAEALLDQEADVRRAAVGALTVLIGQDGLDDMLIDTLQGKSADLSEIAVWAVESLGIEDVDTTLVWLRVIDCCVHDGTNVVPAVAILLTHPVLQVASQAADMVHRFVGADSLGPMLIASLESDIATVRRGAANALANMATGYAPAVASRLGHLKMSTDDAVASIGKLLTDPHVEVRRAAIMALERWAPADVAPVCQLLLRIGRDGSQPEDIRAVALRLAAKVDRVELNTDERDLLTMYEARPVFTRGTEGYHTFRIPAAVMTPSGTLLVFAEGRRHSQSDTGDIDLVLKRSFDQGATWQPLQIVWDSGPHTSGNPTPVVDEITGRIWLFMTHNLGTDTQAQIANGTSQGVRTIWATYSDDDGATWSEPSNLSGAVQSPGTRWDATGPSTGIQLHVGPSKGRLVIPAIGRIIYSDDHGATWHEGGRVEGTSESQVAELTDGRLIRNDRAVARKVPNRRPIAYSFDQGLTWGPVHYARELVTTYAQGSMIRYRPADVATDDILLFSNPATDANIDQVTGAKGHGARVNMTVRVSYDGGETWPVARSLHPGPSGYSGLVGLPDGTVGLVFEGGRNHTYENILFIRFSLAWLEEGAGN